MLDPFLVSPGGELATTPRGFSFLSTLVSLSLPQKAYSQVQLVLHQFWLESRCCYWPSLVDLGLDNYTEIQKQHAIFGTDVFH